MGGLELCLVFESKIKALLALNSSLLVKCPIADSKYCCLL